jgi:hypothetical protein
LSRSALKFSAETESLLWQGGSRSRKEGRCHASDLTDAEWALIEPYTPAVKRLGRPRDRAAGRVGCDLNLPTVAGSFVTAITAAALVTLAELKERR